MEKLCQRTYILKMLVIQNLATFTVLSCNSSVTSLGSNTQIKDSCNNLNEINMNNINQNNLCNSLWNNNTKRKSIIDLEYDRNVEDFIINNNYFKDNTSSILNNLSHEFLVDNNDVNSK